MSKPGETQFYELGTPKLARKRMQDKTRQQTCEVKRARKYKQAAKDRTEVLHERTVAKKGNYGSGIHFETPTK